MVNLRPKNPVSEAIDFPVTSSAEKGGITYIQHNQSFADDAVVINSSSAASLAKWISKNRMTYVNKISNSPTAFPPFKTLCDADMTESLDDCKLRTYSNSKKRTTYTNKVSNPPTAFPPFK